ncbi:MAG: pantoate--beta-alanine ligase [Arenicellales bacterium]
MIQHLSNPYSAQTWCHAAREAGHSIGFVATMGALHEGHASLIQRALIENDHVVVSIFVNPLQFNKTEDLDKYPRDEAADIALLESLGVSLVFTGTPAQFLGEAEHHQTTELKSPGIYAQGLEGDYRPGHFEGVREVVSRLFGFVGPCRAYFGEKDYQQVKIIEQLAEEMNDIEVIACATSREESGLARSSRNQRLSVRGKQDAAIIYQAMQVANDLWQQGERQPKTLQAAMLAVLETSSIDLEYAQVRDPSHWTAQQPEHDIKQARVFIAGNIEGVRLIDNAAMGNIIFR